MDELTKRKIEDSLRHKIDHRPTREELVEHNILKSKHRDKEHRWSISNRRDDG